MSRLTQLFRNIEEINPSPALEKAVLAKIELLQEKKIKRELRWSYAGFLGSLSVLAWVISAFGGTFWQSEFWSIISLAFSDARIVAANWREFLYSGLETFPLVSVAAMLIPSVVLSWSFGQYLEWHNKFNHRYLTN